jgi:hypothetical protein
MSRGCSKPKRKMIHDLGDILNLAQKLALLPKKKAIKKRTKLANLLLEQTLPLVMSVPPGCVDKSGKYRHDFIEVSIENAHLK